MNVRPWRRYFARLFDYYLFGCIFGTIIIFVYSEETLTTLYSPHLETFLSMLLIFIWVFVEASLLSTWGTTPSKSLFGIILRDSAGKKLTFSKALNRSFSVWWRGMGIGFPIVALFTLINSYRRLVREGITHWDHEGKFCISYKKFSGLRILEIVLSFIALALLLVLSTFTENRYQQSVWKEFSSSEGAFSVLLPGTPTEEKELLNTPFGYIDMHTFSIEQENGILYTIVYNDYPDMVIQNRSSNEILNSARDGFVTEVQGKLLSESIISLSGYPGREIDIKLPGVDGYIVQVRIYLIKYRLYQVVVMIPKKRTAAPDIRKFLDSFKLTAI